MTAFQEKWKSYILWSEISIKGFFGENDYRFLSNFELCNVYYRGVLFPSSENAYQAAKNDPKEWSKFQTCAPATSKNLWKDCISAYKRKEWDEAKYDIMLEVVFNKFSQNPDLKKKLLNTKNKYLEETLHWHDNFWGNCVCDKCKNITGQNNLGTILMKVREVLKK